MQDTINKCLGLVGQYNPLSLAPGALIKADNAVIRRENIIEDRRGYLSYGALSDTPTKLFTYLNRVLASYSTFLAYDNGSGTFTNYSGSYSAPTSSRTRSVEAFKNLYITTSTGVKVVTDLAGTAARSAGAPRSLDPSFTLTGSTGFLANSSQCAYRCVVNRTDANSNVFFGYPSQRLWVTNSAGASRNVALTLYLNSECVAGDVIQFYRTAQVSGTSSDLAADEMGLIYQVELAAADIVAGLITFTDSVVDALIGATLYTSPSQEGISQANERPPLAKDIALFKDNFMCYANTETKQRLFVTLVGATNLGASASGTTTNTSTSVTAITPPTGLAIGWKVSGTGIAAGTTVASFTGSTVTLSAAATASGTVTLTFISDKTITLAGVSYSFGTTEITSGVGSPQVQVSFTGVAAADIDLTARSLCRVINRYATNTTVYAYYLSGPDDLPGSMLIESRSVGGAAFTLQGANTATSAMLFPAPPVSPATSTKSTSSNSVQTNGLYISKPGQVEHVPATNYFLVGPANTKILRIAPLRDSLIIIKEEGVYRLTGETFSSMSVVPLDLTVKCKGANTVVVLANQVFMLSNQGVVAVSDSGVQVVSRDIEPSIVPLLSYSLTSTLAAGCAYESERSYLLSVPQTSGDEFNVQTFVYNQFTKTWTKWTFGFADAVVETDSDKLYFIKPNVDKIFKERKDFSDTDYADPELDITITAIAGNVVSFTLSGSAPENGWAIKQADTSILIESVVETLGVYTATMALTPPASWVVGAAQIFPSVGFDIQWTPWTASQPGLLKQVRQTEILTDSNPGANTASGIVATFSTNFDEEIEEVEMLSSGSSWGGAWGDMPWGGAGDSYAFVTYVPTNKQYSTRLNAGVKHVNALEKLSIAGVSHTFEVISERAGNAS